jgi:hypothetical protein
MCRTHEKWKHEHEQISSEMTDTGKRGNNEHRTIQLPHDWRLEKPSGCFVNCLKMSQAASGCIRLQQAAAGFMIHCGAAVNGIR